MLLYICPVYTVVKILPSLTIDLSFKQFDNGVRWRSTVHRNYELRRFCVETKQRILLVGFESLRINQR